MDTYARGERDCHSLFELLDVGLELLGDFRLSVQLVGHHEEERAHAVPELLRFLQGRLHVLQWGKAGQGREPSKCSSGMRADLPRMP